MTNRGLKIIIAAPTFLAPIPTAISQRLRQLLQSDEIVLKSLSGETGPQNERLQQALAQTQPTALIAVDIRPDPDTIAAYTDAGVPIVLVDEEAAGVSTISTDNVAGGRLAAEHFVGLGKKRISIVLGRTKVKGGLNAEQRLEGFRRALGARGVLLPADHAIEVENYTREDGVDVMPQLLKLRVDAVFCAAGDNTAIGMLTVAKDKGVRIPDDVAIIGFDDLFVGQVSSPKLTTIRQPSKEMAEAAYTLITTRKSEILQKPQRLTFSPQLIQRQSA